MFVFSTLANGELRCHALDYVTIAIILELTIKKRFGDGFEHIEVGLDNQQQSLDAITHLSDFSKVFFYLSFVSLFFDL